MSRYKEAHKHRNGPGDERPTAIQVLKDEGMFGKLNGKVAIVTGASSGIGIETARALHEGDAHVFLAVRDMKKGREVAEEIQASGQSKVAVDVLKLELGSLESVRSFAKEFQDTNKTLNLLINNAGVMCCPEGSTREGFETHLGVNHLGHFLLFQLLKDTLLSSSTPDFPSRVICLTSFGHRLATVEFDDLDLRKQTYNEWKAYSRSKTANIHMANEIERRYGSQGLHATAVNPGAIATNLQRHIDPEVVKKIAQDEKMQKLLKSHEQGAATTIWAAVSKEWANKGGVYLEDCQIGEPLQTGEEFIPSESGYKAYIYDKEAYKRLWTVSNKLVGLPEDE